jgi:hypothetical protein
MGITGLIDEMEQQLAEEFYNDREVARADDDEDDYDEWEEASCRGYFAPRRVLEEQIEDAKLTLLQEKGQPAELLPHGTDPIPEAGPKVILRPIDGGCVIPEIHFWSGNPDTHFGWWVFGLETQWGRGPHFSMEMLGYGYVAGSTKVVNWSENKVKEPAIYHSNEVRGFEPCPDMEGVFTFVTDASRGYFADLDHTRFIRFIVLWCVQPGEPRVWMPIDSQPCIPGIGNSWQPVTANPGPTFSPSWDKARHEPMFDMDEHFGMMWNDWFDWIWQDSGHEEGDHPGESRCAQHYDALTMMLDHILDVCDENPTLVLDVVKLLETAKSAAPPWLGMQFYDLDSEALRKVIGYYARGRR